MCAGCTGCLPPVDGGWLPACAVQSDLHSLDAHAIQELREDPGVALDGCPIVPHCGQAKLAGPAGASEGRRWQGGGVSGWHCRLRRGRIECRRTRRASMYAAVTSTHSCSAAGNRDQSVMKVANPPWLRPPSASYTILVCVSRNACESSVSTAHEWVHRRRSSNFAARPFQDPQTGSGMGFVAAMGSIRFWVAPTIGSRNNCRRPARRQLAGRRTSNTPSSPLGMRIASHERAHKL
jgi:hypothetical protein